MMSRNNTKYIWVYHKFINQGIRRNNGFKSGIIPGRYIITTYRVRLMGKGGVYIFSSHLTVDIIYLDLACASNADTII